MIDPDDLKSPKRTRHLPSFSTEKNNSNGIPTSSKVIAQEVSTSVSESIIPSVDPVKRNYVPIREKYIKIVKHCRKIFCEGCEKRGRKDFK